MTIRCNAPRSTRGDAFAVLQLGDDDPDRLERGIQRPDVLLAELGRLEVQGEVYRVKG
jgi:hypothetical protein